MQRGHRTYASRKLSLPTKAFVVTSTIICLLAFESFVRNQDGLLNFAEVCAFFLILTSLQAFSELGYLISWDDDRVYMRPHGTKWNFGRLPETSIRYDAITSVEGAFGPVPGLQRRFMPFDHVRLYGATEGDQEFVTISPNFLKVGDVRMVLSHIYSRRPDAVSPEVVEFINSEVR